MKGMIVYDRVGARYPTGLLRMTEGSNIGFLFRNDSGDHVSGEEGHHDVKVGKWKILVRHPF